jgi:hypothetical protein
MNELNAYAFFEKFESQFFEIRSLYYHLKKDHEKLSEKQLKVQINKILNRITKLDFDKVEENLDILSKHAIHDDMIEFVSNVKKLLEEVKRFIFALQQEEPIEDEDQNISKVKQLDLIRDKYKFLEKQIDSADTETLIKDAKRIENLLARINFEDLPEGDYEELVNIKNDISQKIKTFQGIQKSEKYGPYLLDALSELISHYYTLGSKEKADSRAAGIVDFIENPARIEMFESVIKRIIAKKMTAKEFKRFYDAVLSMMSGERKFESFNSYKNTYNELHIL